MIYKFTQLYRAGTDPLIGYPIQTDNMSAVTNEKNNGKIFVYSGETNEQYTKGGLYLIEGYEEPSLTPFSVGDTINKGTTYTFDKSKGSDIEAMLNGLTYESADGLGIVDLLGTTINGEREPTLCAFDFITAKVLCILDSDTYVPIYATGDFNVGNGFIVGTRGWNIDGDSYTLVKTSRSSTINSILETTPAWNGVLVGKKAPTVLYNLIPSEMIIQENYGGSRSYLKNIDGVIDNMLAGETYNITFEVNGETFTRVGKVIEGNGIKILMNELGNGPIDIIGDTTDYIRYSHYLNIGLENEAPTEGKNATIIITNGIYKDNTPTVKVISYTKQLEPSAVALTAFKNGDTYKTGTRIIFPKSQMANLEAFFRDRLADWTFGEDFDMLHQKGSSGGLFSLMNANGTGVFLLPTSDMMGGMLWFSADMNDMGFTAGWQYQNLVDEGDNYVFTVGEGVEAEVDTDIDFDGKAYLDQWNGIMIGIDNSQVQEQPENSGISLVPFNIGEAFNSTGYVYFDTTKSNDEMTNLMSSLTYTGGSEALCYLIEHERGQLINAMLYNGVYLLLLVEGDPIIIWSSDAFADMGIEGAGWHNLDEEGKISVESDLQITNISDAFNGVIFGKGIQA